VKRVEALLAANRDLLDQRPSDGQPVEALIRRGWDAFLLALEDQEVDAIETSGQWPTHTPPSLRDLIEESRAVSKQPDEHPRAEQPRASASGSLRRRETPRKHAQVKAFATLILPLAEEASRIIDVGSGHGHLTREIAEQIDRPVLGLERNEQLLARARELSGADFQQTDVLLDGLHLQPDDLVIGLHACGELGDIMVESAAETGASIALIGCCLQKRRSARRSFASELELPKRILGLSNLTARDTGVEATRAENLAARERRLALHRLLSAIAPLRHGAEIDGLNRRAAHEPLETLVARAFVHRSLKSPSPAAIAEAGRWAKEMYPRARRLALPRSMLARPLEVFVLLDRKTHLERHDFTVRTGSVFPPEVSARNLALISRRRLHLS
jgi:SAM-dependent methyltransferase